MSSYIYLSEDFLCRQDITLINANFSYIIGYGEERYENVELQRAVVNKFKSLADSTWFSVDATQDSDAVFAVIRDKADDVIQHCLDGNIPLKKLWL